MPDLAPRLLLGCATAALMMTPVASADDIIIDTYDTWEYVHDTSLGLACRLIPAWAPGVPYEDMDDLRAWCYQV